MAKTDTSFETIDPVATIAALPIVMPVKMIELLQINEFLNDHAILTASLI